MHKIEFEKKNSVAKYNISQTVYIIIIFYNNNIIYIHLNKYVYKIKTLYNMV